MLRLYWCCSFLPLSVFVLFLLHFLKHEFKLIMSSPSGCGALTAPKMISK